MNSAALRVWLCLGGGLAAGAIVGFGLAFRAIGSSLQDSVVMNAEARLTTNSLLLEKIESGDVAATQSLLQQEVDTNLFMLALNVGKGARLDPQMHRTFDRIRADRAKSGYLPPEAIRGTLDQVLASTVSPK